MNLPMNLPMTLKTLNYLLLSVMLFFFQAANAAEENTWRSLPAGETLGVDTALQSETSAFDHFNLSYFGIFQGPSISDPSSYQPDLNGAPDPNRPLVLRNFLALGYNFSNELSLAGTAVWNWQPVMKQQVQMLDPFIRLSDSMLIHQDGFNLYSDVRAHFAVTDPSRQSDLLFGFQTFQALTYEVGMSRLTAGLYASARGNIYGKRGYGNDFEFYLGPNLGYQVSPTIALTLLYEMQASHYLHGKNFSFNNEGTDLEPLMSWDVTPYFNLSPYLNILTGGHLSLNTTSVGMMMSVVLM
jgi:hypothetical protein